MSNLTFPKPTTAIRYYFLHLQLSAAEDTGFGWADTGLWAPMRAVFSLIVAESIVFCRLKLLLLKKGHKINQKSVLNCFLFHKTPTHIDVLSDETPLLDEIAWLFVLLALAACPLPLLLELLPTAPVAAAAAAAALVAAVAGPTPKMKR